MTTSQLHVLVVGATGSIGRLVVEEAMRRGHTVRALVRDQVRAGRFPAGTELVVGDLTRSESLGPAMTDIEAVVFTHGSEGDKGLAERVDYGGVRNVLAAIGARPVRVALMTAIGVTNREGAYNRATEAHDWKRRSERLVRASGHPYTIVRPGWFDYNKPGERQLHLLQGDRRHAGNPSDGVIARVQIAEVLVASLTSAQALNTTFELTAVMGSAQSDLDAVFAPLLADGDGALDAIHDLDNMPLAGEPERVRHELDRVRGRWTERE
jgi:uncharacterized protein YbjT (DUF2867 family)